MSKNLMSTEAGGESTQYESISTVTHPHAKQTGQLGSESTTTHSQPAYSSAPSHTTAQDTIERGARTTENIKYGQTISENQPGVAEGSAHVQGGYGGAPALDEGSEGVAEGGDQAAKARRDAGYGGAQDMSNNVGG